MRMHYRQRLPGVRIARAAGLLLLATILMGCGLRTSPPPTAVRPPLRISAREAAQAMADDRFFADYGQATLQIQGQVHSIGQQVVTFETGIPTGVVCMFNQPLPPMQVGATITVQASHVQRQAGDLISTCRML